MTPYPCEADLVVLHALRCGGAASTERVTATVGALLSGDAEDTLLGLAARGLVTHDRGPFGGWRLTEAGRAHDASTIAAELERAGAAPVVRRAYDEFVALNERTLDACGAWQLRSTDPVVLNDHTDRGYDAGVLQRLAVIDAEVQPVCARLAARLERFSVYGPRLARALDRARRGDGAYVTDSVDSYHAVWFQLHEDLLATLGISRESAT